MHGCYLDNPVTVYRLIGVHHQIGQDLLDLFRIDQSIWHRFQIRFEGRLQVRFELVERCGHQLFEVAFGHFQFNILFQHGKPSAHAVDLGQTPGHHAQRVGSELRIVEMLGEILHGQR